MAEQGQSSWLFWRRIAIAPVCLLAVAAWHLYRVTACRQTPWKGGGFGMFSTVASEDSRFLRCRLVSEGGEFPVAVPRFLAREELRARVAPTPEALAKIARLLGELQWQKRGGPTRLEAAEPGTKAANPARLSQVMVELWQYKFDEKAGRLRAEKIDEVQSDLPAAAEGA